MAHPRTLILASTSAYRRELLTRLQLPFDVVAPDVDETAGPGEHGSALALRLALAKAHAVATQHPDAVVIGSDQVATVNGRTLGKPGNHARAVEQLRLMRGQTILFETAVAVVCRASGFERSAVEPVEVTMRDLGDAEIERYLQLEPAYDCAGSAKCEGLGITLMTAIRSADATALVGLPMIRTAALLREAGIDPLASDAGGGR
ncbi:Maf family protein [Piscinibacter sakaiensis]|uniref:Maf family protein n=1 Tax=Piscinibacter sakaiensis TaxID=1547922 RepID=UPI003AAD1FA8